jgi:3-methylcrotonyl-CoA carboxylase alpha subunit
MINSLLIANRGEIACRIIRTAKKMGLRTIAVYSDADAQALHVRLADEACRVGPAAARDSYLNMDAVIAAAKACTAEAIHPGYGFLSENAEFAERCREAGLIFIGPPADAIRAMGGKSQAKALMEKAGVPLVPGYHGDDQNPALLAREADAIGYPVLIKASAGGGGKGMKVAPDPLTFAEQLASAKREAAAAFGDERVLIEKYLETPRHVEIQVFADNHGNCVYLFERDCSIQRRHQKVVEEAPAPDLPREVARRMGEAAVAAARAIGYSGAGTIEFLYDPTDRGFYFMEMNTRLQVEHPVTEMITGVDLVEWQIRVAGGEPLPLAQEDIERRGHAMEVRVYAEDPERDFLPQTGTISYLHFPEERSNIRVDSGVVAGDEISIHYDPMIAKLIVWGEDRAAANRALQSALAQTRILGLQTNLAFLRAIAGHAAFQKARLNTRFIEQNEAELLPSPVEPSAEVAAVVSLAMMLEKEQARASQAFASCDPGSPWWRNGAWRLNGTKRETVRLRDQHNRDVETRYSFARTGVEIAAGDQPVAQMQGELSPDGSLRVVVNGIAKRWTFIRSGDTLDLFDSSGSLHRFTEVDPAREGSQEGALAGHLRAPMPGRIIATLVEAETAVEAGQPLMIIEAMKMEHVIKAPMAGTLKAVHYAVGDQVEDGSELAVIEPREAA